MLRTGSNLRVDSYCSGDEAEILALNRSEYGPLNVMVSLEDFRWRYAENPARRTLISVLRDENAQRVVGFAWAIPVRMRVSGQDCLGAVTANTLIHPGYRGGLTYAKLMRHRWRMIEQHSICIYYGFPVEEYFEALGNAESTSSFLVPLLIRPLNVIRLAGAYFARGLKQSLAGQAERFVAPYLFRNRHRNLRSHRVELTWLEQFDSRFNDFWTRVQDKYPVMAIRNRAFLAWRFASVSGRAYRVLVAAANDELVGYAVLRCTDEIRGVPTGLIMDLLLEPGAQGETAGMMLLDEAWRYFQAEKVWLAGGLALPHTAEYQVLRRAGYCPSPQRLMPRVFRVVHGFGAGVPNDAANLGAKDWFVTIADYEAH